jgi:hypothetical protein
MVVINSKEFAANQNKYFDMAINEQVLVRRGDNMFHLVYTNGNAAVKERVYYEPDEDFYNSLSAEDFRKELVVSMAEIDKIYAEKCK